MPPQEILILLVERLHAMVFCLILHIFATADDREKPLLGLTPPGYELPPLRGWNAGALPYAAPGADATRLFTAVASRLECGGPALRRSWG
ncbi:MAG: hypothetical protein ACLQIB_10745 [Isosphaeraceae bacterium]